MRQAIQMALSSHPVVLLFASVACILLPTSGYHFPDCRAKDDITRIFNILNKVYLEERQPQSNHSTYFTYDEKLKKFIKSDWLYSVTVGREFLGVIWDKNGDNVFKVVYAPTKAIPVKYNEHKDLYHKGGDDVTVEMIDSVQTSAKLRLYQVDQSVYYFDEEKKMLHGQNLSTPIPFDKFLGIFKQEQATYVYLNFGKVYQLTSELNENIQSTQQNSLMDFSRVPKCNKDLSSNKWLIAGIVLQFVFVLFLIYLNIRFATDWLNVKPNGQQSLRIKTPIFTRRNHRSSSPNFKGKRRFPQKSLSTLESKSFKTTLPVRTRTKVIFPSKGSSQTQLNSNASTGNSVTGCLTR